MTGNALVATIIPLRQRRARDVAWQDFFAWCHGRKLRALPAHPWTVAAYLRWCESRRRIGAIPSALDAIAERHARRALDRPDRAGVVRRTLNAVAERQPTRRGAALFRDEDFILPNAAGSTPPPAAKARARAKSPTVAARVLRESKIRAFRAESKARAFRTTPPLVSRRKLDP